MPEVANQDEPENLTPQEQENDPASHFSDENAENPEEQAGA